MRKVLRATAIAAAVGAMIWFALPARSQVITHDPASNIQRIAEAVRAIQQAQAQYRQFEAFYNSITHTTNLAGMAGLIGGMSRQYLPSAGQIGSLLNGQGEWGLSAAMRERNRYYEPQGDDWTAQEMRRREQVTANAQALAAAGLEDSQQQVSLLDRIKDQVEAATDGTTLAALQAAIGLSQQNIGFHSNQVAQIQQMVVAADRVDHMRQEQRRRWGAEQMQQTYPALAGDLR